MPDWVVSSTELSYKVKSVMEPQGMKGRPAHQFIKITMVKGEFVAKWMAE